MKQIIMFMLITISSGMMYMSYIPQLVRMYKRKSSDDISKETWILFTTASILDLMYSVLLEDLGLILYSVSEVIFNLLTIILVIIYKEKEEN